MQEWNRLFQELNFTQPIYRREIVSKKELIEFEISTDIVLPSAYKNFCQVFGSGRFGNLIDIYYPNLCLINRTKIVFDVVKQQLKEYPSKDKLQDEKVINWFSNILIFGSDDRGNVAAWDLKSFDELNKTYDIYCIQVDDFNDEIYKIGSNFFDFVNNFCLGQQIFSFLPEYMIIEPCNSFTPYKAKP